MAGSSFKRHNKVVWPGFSNAPDPRHVIKIGRNDPCPCGDGKKYKDCHESDPHFLDKLVREEEKRQRAELRAHLKKQGVPWYKRIFLSS